METSSTSNDVPKMGHQGYGIFLFAILFVLINIKVLPLMWHFRILYGYLYYYHFNNNPLPTTNTPHSPLLFQSTIYTTHTPLLELDYNLHKSNSTYLTDLDVARGYHLYSIFRTGFKKYTGKNPPIAVLPPPPPGSTPISTSSPRKVGTFFPALGGVSISFRREIKPYTSYEIWSRVLSWDGKWIYILSHFVKPGAGNPMLFSDQPWRKIDSKTAQIAKSFQRDDAVKVKEQAVYAVCVSKYAFKQGRVTVPPETFLEVCGLLPVWSGEEEGEDRELVKIRDVIEARRKEGLELVGNVAGLSNLGIDPFGKEQVVFAKY